ncbi:MAG TPA: hypothetical protein VMY42_04990 [Thermoguttaceae bacterium]|nr:hypothetical protein [Thermoguttaceae bacterium]
MASSHSIHDRVIRAVAAARTEYDAHCNPGQEHNVSVTIDGQTVYPDLVLYQRGTMTVVHLVEVETAESVADTEAAQWAQYARGPGQLWLLVPTDQLATAQVICRRRSITAEFGRWWSGPQGIAFEWLQAVAASR